MANLSGFLNPAYKEKTIEVIISDRFLDENGEPIPFKLKSLPQTKMKAIAKRSMKTGQKNSNEVDAPLFIVRCIVESCIQPDFKSKDICERYDTEDPLEVPERMLLASEYEKLGRAFLDLNGIEEGGLEVTGVSKN